MIPVKMTYYSDPPCTFCGDLMAGMVFALGFLGYALMFLSH